MNRYEEIYSLIEIINEKINNIDKELLKVEEVQQHFNKMDTFIEPLQKYFKESDTLFTKSIERTKALNITITDELLNEYEIIFKDLQKKCNDIITELLDSVGFNISKVEVLDLDEPVERINHKVKIEPTPIISPKEPGVDIQPIVEEIEILEY